MDAESRCPTAECLAKYLAVPCKAWSLGSFGAIAEFMWSADEPCLVGTGDAVWRVTPRGGIRVTPADGATLVAYETPSRFPERRRRDVALCLPREAARMGQRDVVTELGPDDGALRPDEREHVLFDMGLDQLQVDVLVRTADPDTIVALRDAEGRSIFDPAVTLMRELPRLSPHRVFVTRCGRIEVYQAIPPADGKSPDGPHTHVLPKLLRSQRTHAANIPIPDDLVPCLTVHLSRPAADHATTCDQGD